MSTTDDCTFEVLPYVAGQPGQCNVIIRGHVSPETILDSSAVIKDQDYFVPPNVPVFTTQDAMNKMTNGFGKRSRTGAQTGIPIIANTNHKQSDVGSGANLIFVGISVGHLAGGKDSPDRCISIAVTGTMSIPLATKSATPEFKNFQYGQQVYFVRNTTNYDGCTDFMVGTPTTSKARSSTDNNIISTALGPTVTCATCSDRELQIVMH